MSEFLNSIPGGTWVIVATAGVVFGCLIPISAIITTHLQKVRQAELDNQLKRDLVAQGKSPEEIEAILAGSSEVGMR